MSQAQTQTKLLPPEDAVRLAWALTGQFTKAEDSQHIYAFSADKVLKDIQGQAKGGPEQEYVDSAVAIIAAGMRTLDTIYKHRELNFAENDRLRSVALENAREKLVFGRSLGDFVKSLPAMTVVTGVGVSVSIIKNVPDIYIWLLGILLAAASYWINLWAVRRWHERREKSYLRQDYERNLYFEHYVTRVGTILTSMYLDIDRVHERAFGQPYPLEPPERASHIVEEMLKGIKHTMCDRVHRHMREGKVTPRLWPLCETGGKAAEKCVLREEVQEIVYESSDWHIRPEGLPPQVRDWIVKGKEEQAMLIGNGDLSAFMYCRWQGFIGSKAVRELETVLDGYPLTYIANNHDPIRFVRSVYAHIQNIEVVEEKDVLVGDTLYHFEHGSRFAIDWRLLQKVNHWIASWFPGFWLCWQNRRGRLPSQLKEKADHAATEKESERYRHHIGIIWRNALRDALKRTAVTVIGHTHKYGKHEHAEGAGCVDGGDMQKDCDYLRITGQGVEHLWAVP